MTTRNPQIASPLEVRKAPYTNNRWQLYHLPTGLPIPHSSIQKRKDVTAFMNAIKDKWPWQDWKVADRSEAPDWADDAILFIRNYFHKDTIYANTQSNTDY